jgi:16S rRNA (guanine(966)-N(2))-methyltransferase RsmD
MRIIGGRYRGMKLSAPKDNAIRPTTDRVKEDIFNILQPYVRDSAFLDLFSGSGAIGIEAVSRGAAQVDLVECSRASIRLIQSNIERLPQSDRPRMIPKKAEQFLLANSNKYDIIFLDPPYADPNVPKILSLIQTNGTLQKDGIIVLEQGLHGPMEHPAFLAQLDLVIYKTKRYSSTILYFIKHNLSKE